MVRMNRKPSRGLHRPKQIYVHIDHARAFFVEQPNSPLREVLLREPEEMTIEDLLAKVPTWEILLQLESAGKAPNPSQLNSPPTGGTRREKVEQSSAARCAETKGGLKRRLL